MYMIILALLASPLLVIADFVPTAPGPGDVFKPGGQCTIQWTPDTSGKWKQTNIELMTGSNSPMVHLTTVGTVDGTDPTKTSFAFPCPTVSPGSPIYFYQFTAPGVKNTTWTGRFTITDPSGGTTLPANNKQPDGQNIPWGTGKLLGVKGTPPPPSAPSGQLDGSSGNGNSSALTPGSPSPASASISLTLEPQSTAAPSPSLATVASPLSTTVAGAASTPPPVAPKNNGVSLLRPSPALAFAATFLLPAIALC